MEEDNKIIEGEDDVMSEDEEMADTEQQYKNLSDREFLDVVASAFDDEGGDDEEEDDEQEIDDLYAAESFIPQIIARLENVQLVPHQISELYCEFLDSLGTCYLITDQAEKAFSECFGRINQHLIDRKPKDPTKEYCALVVNSNIKMAAMSIRLRHFANAIKYYQNAADVIVPRIFEHSDMSPVPTLISIVTHRIHPCVQEQSWATLKDDLQTVATVGDILEQLEEMVQTTGDMEMHGVIFEIKQKRSEFLRKLKEHIDISLLQNILQGHPEIEIEPQDCRWIIQEFNKITLP